jgi:hypothetical protein
MTLGVEDAALQPSVLALAHDPLHVFLEHLQVPEHNPFELAAALRIRRNRFQVLQRQGHVARKNLLTERGGPPEATVQELLDIAQTQILAAQNQDELLDVLRADAVHAHELAHDPHVGINRKGAAEELFPHLGADLPQQAQPHAHPGFADREFDGNLRHTQVPDVFEFIEESRLLEDTQTFVLGGAQQVQNPADLVGPDRRIGHGVQAQLAGTAIALESIEQHRRGLAPGGAGGQVNAFQRLLNATLGNRHQKPGFDRRHFQAIVLIPQVQRGQFNLACHTEVL